MQHIDALRSGRSRHADRVGQLLALRIGQAQRWINNFSDDFFGRVVRDTFDVHATFAGNDERHALRGAVCHGRHVVLVLDISAVFNQQTAHFLADWPSLVRDQLHAQNFPCEFAHVVN